MKVEGGWNCVLQNWVGPGVGVGVGVGGGEGKGLEL